MDGGAAESGEVGLFSVAEVGGELVPASTKRRASRKASRQEAESVPVTPQGDNAGDIVAAWIDWYMGANNGVPIPQTIIARIGKQVRGLILSGYPTNDIKFGLAYWTIKHLDTGAPPNQLDTLVWEWATKTRGNHARWRSQAVEAINAFSGGQVSASQVTRNANRGQRQQAANDQISQWASRKGAQS